MKKSVILILLILPLLIINCGGIGESNDLTADSQAVSVDEDSSISITTTASHPVDSPLLIINQGWVKKADSCKPSPDKS